ncbi:MAG: hypothetical protein ACRDFX_00700 [Chloroflexota bacterium]
MFKAYIYLLISGAIWMVEGFLFSYYLGFAAWQIALIGVIYVALFGAAVYYLIRALKVQPRTQDGISAWRLVSVAPMLVVIIGSFASLPLIIIVAAIGKL